VVKHVYKIVLSIVALLILSACRPQPTPIPPATPIPPTDAPAIVTVIVTRTPTETPPPTPLPFDPINYVGDWLLDLSYQVYGNPAFNNLRYDSSSTITVNADGSLGGSVRFYAQAGQYDCTVQVWDAEELTATVQGLLRVDGAGAVVADITLVPDDPEQTNLLWMFCARFGGDGYQESVDVLWQSLRLTDGFTFTVPMEFGAQQTTNADLTGAGWGGLRGSITRVIRLSR
jgi:hypothetical protein